MKRILILLTLFIPIFSVIAQDTNLELISTAGDSYQNNSYQLDWAIGEIAVKTFSSDSQILTQGFHQGSLEISTLINHSDFDINMKIYPNPTSSYIHLNTEIITEKLSVNITSLSGTTIFSGEICTSPWQFNFSSYAAGTYILLVSNKNKPLKSFKIIKQ